MPPATSERPVERFAPTSGLLPGYAGLVVALATLAYVASSVHSLTGLRIALAAVFGGCVVWVTQIRPRATAYPRHVVLRNSLRDVHVPLASVDEVVMGSTLRLHVGERRFVCIGIGETARSELRARRAKDSSLGTSRLGELSLKAERANLDERAMSYQTFVLTRLEHLVEEARREARSGGAGRRGAGVPEPRVVWAWPEVAGLVLSGAALAASLLL